MADEKFVVRIPIEVMRLARGPGGRPYNTDIELGKHSSTIEVEVEEVNSYDEAAEQFRQALNRIVNR